MTYTINDTDIYKNGVPLAPAGYKIIGFRVPTKGESFFDEVACSANPKIIHNCGAGWPTIQPRLIVEPVKRLRIVLEEVFKGESYSSGINSQLYIAGVCINHDGKGFRNYKIVEAA